MQELQQRQSWYQSKGTILKITENLTTQEIE